MKIRLKTLKYKCHREERYHMLKYSNVSVKKFESAALS